MIFEQCDILAFQCRKHLVPSETLSLARTHTFSDEVDIRLLRSRCKINDEGSPELSIPGKHPTHKADDCACSGKVRHFGCYLSFRESLTALFWLSK